MEVRSVPPATSCLLASVLLLVSCTRSVAEEEEARTATEVDIAGLAFSPSTLAVPAGTTVTWVNKDFVTHTVTGRTGTQEQYRTIHPSMTGAVVVETASQEEG